MELNSTKFETLTHEEIQNVDGGGWGDWYTGIQIAWEMTKDYSKGPGPAMEGSYKHGMPGGKW
ncbi:hypothetical protein M3215_19680 [Bacillus cytotoxicus]|uniref:Uncharacterized protein n=1 Tax=Bacillus cytotoxicus TaxID=580165 RepID=A0ACC6ADE6_9BACI|nr:hypothetical protein [Bacillus cytotoxicus]